MQCSRAVKKEQRSLIQHKPPKDTTLSDGKHIKIQETVQNVPIYITGQGKEQKGK